MIQNNNIQLYYEWNTVHSKLEYSIKTTQKQLATVEKRLKSLKDDLKIYIALLTIPVVALAVLSFFANACMFLVHVNPIPYLILVLVQTLVLCAYVISFPLNFYYMLKTYHYIKLNKENEELILPLAEGSSRGYEPLPEKNFRDEYDKLVYMLTRYYHYQEIMKSIYDRIKSDTCNMSLEDLRAELGRLLFYEVVKPANTYSGEMESKARKRALIFIGIVMLVLVMIAFFQ